MTINPRTGKGKENDIDKSGKNEKYQNTIHVYIIL